MMRFLYPLKPTYNPRVIFCLIRAAEGTSHNVHKNLTAQRWVRWVGIRNIARRKEHVAFLATATSHP